MCDRMAEVTPNKWMYSERFSLFFFGFCPELETPSLLGVQKKGVNFRVDRPIQPIGRSSWNQGEPLASPGIPSPCTSFRFCWWIRKPGPVTVSSEKWATIICMGMSGEVSGSSIAWRIGRNQIYCELHAMNSPKLSSVQRCRHAMMNKNLAFIDDNSESNDDD